jgi:PhnB protein
MKIEPYLFFNGRCEEAIEFYRQAVGAKVEALIRFKESPEPPNPDCPVPQAGTTR